MSVTVSNKNTMPMNSVSVSVGESVSENVSESVSESVSASISVSQYQYQCHTNEQC